MLLFYMPAAGTHSGAPAEDCISLPNCFIPVFSNSFTLLTVLTGTQVTGCQRILLIPPDQAFDGMYPYPVHHPYDTYSMVDLEKPDVGQWPHNAKVKGLCCILKPGDVLYLPAYWYVLQAACGMQTGRFVVLVISGYVYVLKTSSTQKQTRTSGACRYWYLLHQKWLELLASAWNYAHAWTRHNWPAIMTCFLGSMFMMFSMLTAWRPFNLIARLVCSTKSACAHGASVQMTAPHMCSRPYACGTMTQHTAALHGPEQVSALTVAAAL